jgi:hypothetical protein
MRDAVRQNQLRHVLEVIKTQTTRDLVADDGVYIQTSPGPGWHVLDAHRERFTRWQRRKPVVLPRRWRRKY